MPGLANGAFSENRVKRPDSIRGISVPRFTGGARIAVFKIGVFFRYFPQIDEMAITGKKGLPKCNTGLLGAFYKPQILGILTFGDCYVAGLPTMDVCHDGGGVSGYGRWIWSPDVEPPRRFIIYN
jgi:hypothetical protein